MGRVIRAHGTPRRVDARVVNAGAEAERILRGAQDTARSLVAEAAAEADALRELARAEGKSAAEAEAATLLADAAHARKNALAGLADETRALAVEVAERLVAGHLSTSPESIVAITREALALAQRARDVRVRVHPDDAPLLEAAGVGSAPNDDTVTLIPDASIARGGCEITTNLGTIDARLATRIDVLRSALLGRRR